MVFTLEVSGLLYNMLQFLQVLLLYCSVVFVRPITHTTTSHQSLEYVLDRYKVPKMVLQVWHAQ